MPVLTCPKCGAITTSDRGSANCSYCGTFLDASRAGGGYPGAPSATVGPNDRKAVVPLLIAVGVSVSLVAGGAMFFLVSRGVAPPAPASTVTPGAPAVTVTSTTGRTAPGDPLAQIENAQCLSNCMTACTQITDPTEMSKCLEGCQTKCNMRVTPTGPECRARCDKTCNAAPDSRSKQLCSANCTKNCPP